MLTHLEKIKLKNHDAVMVVKASANGRAFHHVIRMNEESVKKLYSDIEKAIEVDFGDYGEILFSGWGEEPSAEVMEKIEKMNEE